MLCIETYFFHTTRVDNYCYVWECDTGLCVCEYMRVRARMVGLGVGKEEKGEGEIFACVSAIVHVYAYACDLAYENIFKRV